MNQKIIMMFRITAGSILAVIAVLSPSTANALSFNSLPKSLQPSIPSMADPALFEQLCKEQGITKASGTSASQVNYGCKAGTYEGLAVTVDRAIQACASVLQSQAAKAPVASNAKIVNTSTGYNVVFPKPLSNPPQYNPIQVFNCQSM